MNLAKLLSTNKSLFTLLTLTIVFTASFHAIVQVWDLTLLDDIIYPETARTAIEGMSHEQIRVHFFLNSTIDILNPFIYGSLLLGIIYRLFPNIGKFLILPVFVLIPVELLEGTIQLLALSNIHDLLDIKMYITSLKFMLLITLFSFASIGTFKYIIALALNKYDHK